MRNDPHTGTPSEIAMQYVTSIMPYAMVALVTNHQLTAWYGPYLLGFLIIMYSKQASITIGNSTYWTKPYVQG